MKDINVYFVSVDDLPDNISAINIMDWNDDNFENDSRELCEDAIKFCRIAEKNGNVLSLYQFQNMYNLDDIGQVNSWIFITNRY